MLEFLFTVDNLFFWFFLLISFSSSLFSISSRNPIYSVLFLITVYFSASLIFFFIESELISIVIFIVYIGAVSILFLFVIMMLEVKFMSYYISKLSFFFFLSLIVLIFFLQILLVFKQSFFFNYNNFLLTEFNFAYINNLDWLNVIFYGKVVSLVGFLLYTLYSVLFIMSGLVLFTAMLGSVVLTLDTDFLKLTTLTSQDIFSQVYRFYGETFDYNYFYNKYKI